MEQHHHHPVEQGNLNRAFVLGILINAAYVLLELSAGIYYHSLSLISDAGHNLSDVAALALALLAFRLSRAKANSKFTYGYRKSTILVSLINSVVLFIAIGGIIWESINRLQHPVEISGRSISIVAGIGIVINAVSAMLFFREKEKDLNVKGAYLHLMADAAVSSGVVISGILISLFHFYWLDMAMSILIVAVIFYSTWQIFRDSLFLSLDGVPRGIHLDVVIAEIMKVPGVTDVHHLHVWAMSTSQNAMTAHIVVDQCTGLEEVNRIKQNIKRSLEAIHIHHSTLEFETGNDDCGDVH